VHCSPDVQALDCDFYVFTGHKLFGPTGIGGLYGKRAALEALPPYQGGGEMIATVTEDAVTYAGIPHRFEAGTPPFAQVLGLGAAIDYLEAIGVANIGAWEHGLLTYATERLEQVPGLRIVGTSPNKAGILGFTMDGIHPFDIGSVLDQEGIAIRVGQHCVQPVMAHYGIHSTARASIGPYTSQADIDALIAGLHTVRDLLA
jgi:cysteine desulfurase/selenocysteine lyase